MHAVKEGGGEEVQVGNQFAHLSCCPPAERLPESCIALRANHCRLTILSCWLAWPVATAIHHTTAPLRHRKTAPCLTHGATQPSDFIVSSASAIGEDEHFGPKVDTMGLLVISFAFYSVRPKRWFRASVRGYQCFSFGGGNRHEGVKLRCLHISSLPRFCEA